MILKLSIFGKCEALTGKFRNKVSLSYPEKSGPEELRNLERQN